jgi:hypothetical protein
LKQLKIRFVQIWLNYASNSIGLLSLRDRDLITPHPPLRPPAGPLCGCSCGCMLDPNQPQFYHRKRASEGKKEQDKEKVTKNDPQ